ncbi:ammonium transporter [Eubacteriaceae bacterium ES2]|nr:ammonium transporter [Eubacteriaceae bacterium ES2]
MEYELNSLWVLVAGVLVFFMQAGFALLEAGIARQKNTVNILMKNFMDFGLGTIAYCLVGFGLMYGADLAGIAGSDLFLNPLGYDTGGTLSPSVFFFFQLMFCAATATIVSGAVAERTNFGAYLIFSFIISAVIYPIGAHWIWGGGWLANLGFMDFAGSTAVHSIGGWCAMMGALFVGPRIGKYTADGKVNAFTPSNIFMACLGFFILWLGWYGFNPGSELAFDENVLYTAVSTTIAVGAGSVAAMFITWKRYGKPDIGISMNGALGALVGITAGCKFVSLPGAAIIGVIAATAVIFSVEFFDRVVKIDDPVGAISVHGVGGAVGTLCVGLFAVRETELTGLFYGGGLKLLGIQAVGVLSIFAWAVVTSGILFFVINKVIKLRVSEKDEMMGLDISEHASEAYPEFITR